MEWTEDQLNTIDVFIDFLATPDQKFMVIQGASGSGKSTMIKHLAKMAEKHKAMSALLLQKNKRDVGFNLVLAATTNPASTVLENFTKKSAGTIHSHLGLAVKNNYKTGKKYLVLRKGAEKIHDSLIIIDEASMINRELLDIIDQRTKNCKIVLIGDQYQLAPVNQTATVMETLQCPKSTMNKIMRNSGIIMETGAQFRKTVETGIFKPIPTGHKSLFKADGPTFQRELRKAFTSEAYGINTARLLAWTNNRVQECNAYIRCMKGYPTDFQVGEVVITNKPIQTKGYYKPIDSEVTITCIHKPTEEFGVYGRMVEVGGCFTSFLPDNPGAERILLSNLAAKKEWKDFFVITDTWLDLRLPYASTVHKAQGHTYDTVFIDLSDIGKCRISSDVARMLYVAITRSSEQVYLHGDLPECYGGGSPDLSQLMAS
jgi:energy-coupling factor transporter ATP-binding protein EcfA2